MSRRAELNISGNTTVMDMGRLLLAHPLDVDTGRQINFASSASGPKRLLVFLTAADCSSCLAETGDWVGIAKAYAHDKFEVDMLFLHTAPAELSSFRASYNFPYRMLLDHNDEIATLVDIPPKTPVVILVDGKFRVLATEGPEQDMKQRQIFLATIGSLINK